MRRAIVTGGAGFLGSHISDALTARGFEVAVLDREVSPWLGQNQRMVVGDVLDGTALAKACAGAECCFHLAALADLERAHDDALETARANVLGTVNALEAARTAGVARFVFASTVYVYSRAGGFYRVSKQAGEAYVEEFGRQHGLPFTILRYGSLYGPRSGDGNGVYRLLREAAATGHARLVGAPDDAREYVHVEDAARLSVDALAPEHANQHLIVTGAHPTRLRDLFTMFSELLGREVAVEYVEPDSGRGVHYRMTPYAYIPRPARRLTSTSTIDMGQGLLQLLEEMHAADGVAQPGAAQP